MGTVAPFVVGLAACTAGGESCGGGQPNPFLTIAPLPSGVATLLLVGGLTSGTAAFFFGLTAVIILKWVLATTHHVVDGFHGARSRPSAA
jgi:hypothetical protein